MQFALNNIYKIILKLDVPEWPTNTDKTLDLCWPIEYFGHKDSTIQEIIAMWKPKWAHYTPGGNEAKYYWEKKKTMVNPMELFNIFSTIELFVNADEKEEAPACAAVVDTTRVAAESNFQIFKSSPLLSVGVSGGFSCCNKG